MADDTKYWTTVGSTGTLSAADLAKVSLNGAVIQLGTGIAPPAAAAEDPSIITRQMSAVVRYNITPVDGLFVTGGLYVYILQVRFRGTVSGRLVQFDVSSGTETDLAQFDRSSPDFTTEYTETAVETVLDFVNCAYYVEATLTASATVVGNPAEIAAIKVYPSFNF